LKLGIITLLFSAFFVQSSSADLGSEPTYGSAVGRVIDFVYDSRSEQDAREAEERAADINENSEAREQWPYGEAQLGNAVPNRFSGQSLCLSAIKAIFSAPSADGMTQDKLNRALEITKEVCQEQGKTLKSAKGSTVTGFCYVGEMPCADARVTCKDRGDGHWNIVVKNPYGDRLRGVIEVVHQREKDKIFCAVPDTTIRPRGGGASAGGE